MNSVNRLFVPLLAAVAAVALTMMTLTAGAEAEIKDLTPGGVGPAVDLQAPAARPRQLPIVLDQHDDFRISDAGGNLPQIAANNTFVAVAFERNSSVYLRSATSNGFGITVALDGTNSGNEPKIAFRPGSNVVHIVWRGSEGRLIRHRSCTLSDPLPTCGTLSTVATDNDLPRQLTSPDVAVSGDDAVHVVWRDGDVNKLFSRRSENGNNWNTSAVEIGNVNTAVDPAPALATAGNLLHLAYVNQIGGDWLINYRRSGINSHNWSSASASYNSNVTSYGQIFNPTIAAVGSKVFVAWDQKKNGAAKDIFGLMGSFNPSNGNNGAWPPVASHITSTASVTTTDPSNERLSQEDDVPSVENTLRPSVAVKGNDFVVVWAQRPDAFCQSGGEGGTKNGSPEIFYAASLGNDWGSQTGILANNRTDATVAPDIAVNGTRTHVVFLKGNVEGACAEGVGGPSDYSVYYRGPWGKESDKVAKVLFPIIEK